MARERRKSRDAAASVDELELLKERSRLLTEQVAQMRSMLTAGNMLQRSKQHFGMLRDSTAVRRHWPDNRNRRHRMHLVQDVCSGVRKVMFCNT